MQKTDKRKDDLEGQKKGKVIKFGWIEGVYVSWLMLTRLYSLLVSDEMSPQHLGGDALPQAHLGHRPVWDM